MKGTMMLTGAAMGFGLSPMLAQILLQQGMSPEVVALYRFAIPALLVLPCVRVFKVQPAESMRTFALGAFAALGMLAFLYSFTWLPATTVILTYYTYPLFALAIGWALFGHGLTRNRLISAALILLAVLTMQGPLSQHQIPLGVLCIGFVAPASYALLINYLSNPVQHLKTGERMSACLVGHLAVLIPLTYWQAPAIVLPQSEDQLWLILAIALLASAFPQYLFARGAVLAGMERTTMISTSEIVFALLFSVLLLNSEISRLEMIASTLILISGLIRLEPRNEELPSNHKFSHLGT
ncbi:DMT family transporter [Pontibacterium granulatum]|uniref:DMT family transporter n=1 Tax=Pontibacterium granulatum TaxID=2036029 RepID=UPI00249CF3D1|nr:DMT family transporter [Pontibacterium granulatum]MDI3325584.1 DMT family transporter [Pontibacterium granulatum]